MSSEEVLQDPKVSSHQIWQPYGLQTYRDLIGYSHAIVSEVSAWTPLGLSDVPIRSKVMSFLTMLWASIFLFLGTAVIVFMSLTHFGEKMKAPPTGSTNARSDQ